MSESRFKIRFFAYLKAFLIATILYVAMTATVWPLADPFSTAAFWQEGVPLVITYVLGEHLYRRAVNKAG